MKKILYIFLACTLAVACEKTPVNGDLDGKWKLYEIHSKLVSTDAAYTQAADVQSAAIYWNFQLQLLSITSAETLNGHTQETVARFVHEGDNLALTETYIHYRDRDSLIVDPNTTSLQALGIRGNTAQYRVATLTSTRMTLCSTMDSLVFRKTH